MAVLFPDLVEQAPSLPTATSPDGTLSNLTTQSTDGNLTITAGYFFANITPVFWSCKITFNAGLSGLANGDFIRLYLNNFHANFQNVTLRMYAYDTASTVVSANLQELVNPVSGAWNTITLDTAFIGELVDISGDSSGKFAVRVGVKEVVGALSYTQASWTEVDADLTAPGGGVAHLAVASATATVLVGQAKISFAFESSASADGVVTVSTAPGLVVARKAVASANAVVAVDTSTILITKPVSASVNGVVSVNTSDITYAAKATASATGTVVLQSAALDIGSSQSAAALATGSVVVTKSDITYAAKAVASADGVVTVSTAPGLVVARKAVASANAVVTVNTSDIVYSAKAVASVDGVVVVTGSALTILSTKIDLAATRDLVGLEGILLFSDKENWWVH